MYEESGRRTLMHITLADRSVRTWPAPSLLHDTLGYRLVRNQRAASILLSDELDDLLLGRSQDPG
jgi:hypothetical protein